MKKIFFFAAACAAMLTSCSDDDSSSSGGSNAPLSVKVNGTLKKFSNVEVELEGQRVYVVAMSTNHSEILSFETDLGYTGDGYVFYVQYVKDNTIYWEGENTTSNVEVNTENRLKGTFGATVESYNDNGDVDETLTLTNGKFDLPY
ncbi:hypothetical protein [Flavobacterium sp.]|uniref:hypothetical protein n=1 Tax=Flavobacterium sp. TaxID=239 RepID=UPI0040334773